MHEIFNKIKIANKISLSIDLILNISLKSEIEGNLS